MKTTYKTLAESATAEFKDKGSKFIAFAYPVSTVDDVKRLVDDLKQTHHKARHWCYAYRLGLDGHQFRANDDGEPSGSAGRPILGQIDSAGLIDTLVVVVRYFGGTLLGVPGLIHAYKTVTHQALKKAHIIEKNVGKTIQIRCDYPYLSEVLRIAKHNNAEILIQDLQLDCSLILRVPLAHYDASIIAWNDMRVIHIKLLE